MPPLLLENLISAPNLPELLQQGQRFWAREQKKRKDFLNDITPNDKWEFINGEVVMHSPALHRHLVAAGNIYQILFVHVQSQKCGSVFIEKALTSFPRNEYEPDVTFFGEAKSALLDAETLRFPVPDLIVEVLSPGTEARDRGVKFQDYALNGVSEYWIVDTVSETVELYVLDVESASYPPTARLSSGMLESGTLPGLRFPVEAIFDEAATLAVLREMNAGEEVIRSLQNALWEAEASLVEERSARGVAERAKEVAEQAKEAAERARDVEKQGREAAENVILELQKRLDLGGANPPKK